MLKYQHGGDIKSFAQTCACDVSEVIDLSSNINFVKPILDIDFNCLDISAYPNYEALYHNIATRYDVQSSELELFNGATSAIDVLFRTLGLQHCTLYAPIYGEYQKSAKCYGYEIDLINRLEDLHKPVKAKSLIIFVNPSTPDGMFYNIDELMKEWIAKKATIVMDESFLDFTSCKSSTSYLKSYEKLYILKSMTKFYAAAGIRIGTLISSEKNIHNIREKEPLWKLSEFDSHYIQSALRDHTFIEKSHHLQTANKNYLIEIVKKCTFMKKIYPSDANFILIKLKGINAENLQNKLIPYKIMIRNCANFNFLDDSFVRIAVKDIIALQKLKEALCEIST